MDLGQTDASSDKLVMGFVRFWLDQWPEAEEYDQVKLATIYAHLCLVVSRRYFETNGKELRFTPKELEEVIKSATAPPERIVRRGGSKGQTMYEICFGYIAGLHRFGVVRDSYSKDELRVICGRLLGLVVDRYRKSNYTKLVVGKAELRDIDEWVESMRSRRARDARMDERDRRIKQTRRYMGVLADACTVTSEE